MYGLGNLLIKLRGSISLREAAKRSGLSYSYISSLEKGKHPRTGAPINPTPEILRNLAKAYSYPYDELMKLAGYMDEEGNVASIKETELERKKNKLKSIIDAMNDESELDYTTETIERLRKK